MNDQFDNIAILAVRQKLSPAFEGDPIKPPTFAGNNNEPTYVTYDVQGRHDCIIDTQPSQANRIEPLFDGSGLIPDSTVKVEEKIVPLTALGHRIADAALRFSDGAQDVTAALDSAFSGDNVPLAKLAPTSLLFGAWDSRGNVKVKLTRVVRAEIRASNVSKPIAVLGQYRSSVNRPVEGDNKELSAEGLLDCPTNGLGGVVVNGEITRTVQVNVRAIRKMGNPVLQDYILGLGLVALLAPADLDLREGCNLVVASTTVEAVKEDGTRHPFPMTYEQAVDFARKSAEQFGVGAARYFVYDEANIRAKIASRAEEKNKKADKAKSKRAAAAER